MNKRIQKKIITRIIKGNLAWASLTRLEQRVWDKFNIRTSMIVDPIIAEIKEEERRKSVEDAATAPLWMQARKDEIKRINDANEYDTGSISNHDPDKR